MWECVRRFGLEYCDLPTMLSNVSALLRTLALNVDGRDEKRIPLMYTILTAIASVLYIYAYVFSGYWYTFWYALKVGELLGAFIAFSTNVTSQVSIIKLFYMMFYEEKLKALTNKYLALDACIPKGSRFSNNMLKSLRHVKRRGIIFWLILMTNAVAYVAQPLLTPGRHLTVDSYVIYGLNPMLESPNYEIAAVITAIDVIFVCFTVANVTCFLILIIGYIEAQLLSLSEEMIHLYGDALYHLKKTAVINDLKSMYVDITSDEVKIMNKYVKDHLIDIIGKHATNVSFLREIEDFMKGPNAIGYVYLLMGLIAELLGGLEKTCLQLPFTMLQLSVDCYLGQKVMDSNIKFEQAIYACKWENFNNSNMKIVLVMLQNSQKTITLTAGGMATLNFCCLMSIIKTTYSSYTTLRSMI